MKSHFLSTHAKCKNRNKDTHLNKQKSREQKGGRLWCTPTSTERCFLFVVLRVRPCHVTWTTMRVGDLLDALALQMSHNCRNTCFTLFFFCWSTTKFLPGQQFSADLLSSFSVDGSNHWFLNPGPPRDHIGTSLSRRVHQKAERPVLLRMMPKCWLGDQTRMRLLMAGQGKGEEG